MIVVDRTETPYGLTVQRKRDGLYVDAVTFEHGGRLTFYHYLRDVNNGPLGGCSALNGNYCGRMRLDKETTSSIPTYIGNLMNEIKQRPYNIDAPRQLDRSSAHELYLLFSRQAALLLDQSA